MHILIAPDSFKDCLSATEVAEAIARGAEAARVGVTCDLCPVSDGGEGFAKAFLSGAGDDVSMVPHEVDATDPLGRRISVSWHGFTDRTSSEFNAVIELASASGLELLAANERDPMRTSTFGTGEVIMAALDSGAKHMLLGIGGSATNDGGCGIAQALGAVFYDGQGMRIDHAIAGGDLLRIARIDLSAVKLRGQGSQASGLLAGKMPAPLSREGLRHCTLRVACDVTNPLTGENGAAHVYGPQKGAMPEQVEQLNAGLRHLAQLWRDQLGVDVEHLPGAGAAGGVGGGLVAMLGGELVAGADLVLDGVGFDERAKKADLVITGEGCFDGQSTQGKVVTAIAKRAVRAGVPCVALVGRVDGEIEPPGTYGLEAIYEIGRGLEAAESIGRATELLASYAKKAVAGTGC